MVRVKEWINKNPLLSWIIPIAGVFLVHQYKNRKRKIFVSYYYADNHNYKNTLKMWCKNDEVDFHFYDESADVSIKSTDDGVIRQVISRKVNKSDLILCIIGEKTHKRKWVDWELEKAKDLNKRIIAVKIKSTYKSPESLLNSGVTFVKSFKQKDILNAINKF